MIKKLLTLLLSAILLMPTISVFAEEIDTNQVTVPIILYHAIEENYPDEISNLAITSKLFEEHMQALLKHGYTTISFQEYMDFKFNNAKLPEKPIIIAFDDGYLSNYTKAYPILLKYRMKATIFIVASTVGKQYPEVNYAHFTWDQARTMINSGLIEIGSHTYYHNDVSQYSSEKANLDLRLSKYLIDTNLGFNCKLLAFPYGLFTEENQQQALEAGYTLSCKVGDVGVNTKDTPITELKRLTIFGTYTSENVINYINVQTERELEGWYN
ncbi:MAG: polysaccharide deacetylase family protein [Eubacteriales bacterium]|nr:polysaccharide deacetylase family protein [Eubacteriales bacterium]